MHSTITEIGDGAPGQSDPCSTPAWTEAASCLPTDQAAGWCSTANDAPLCFANSEDFRRLALIDITAADVLQEFHDELTAKGIVFGMAKVKQDLYQQLSKAGVVGRIGAERIFPTLQKAIAAFRLEQPAQTAPSSISSKA